MLGSLFLEFCYLANDYNIFIKLVRLTEAIAILCPVVMDFLIS